MKSAKDFPHQVYLILRDGKEYVGITANLKTRLRQHAEEYEQVSLLGSFEASTRREAEGVEAQLHQILREYRSVVDYFDSTFLDLHSLWFNSRCKGFPKYLTQRPRLTF